MANPLFRSIGVYTLQIGAQRVYIAHKIADIDPLARPATVGVLALENIFDPGDLGGGWAGRCRWGFPSGSDGPGPAVAVFDSATEIGPPGVALFSFLAQFVVVVVDQSVAIAVDGAIGADLVEAGPEICADGRTVEPGDRIGNGL